MIRTVGLTRTTRIRGANRRADRSYLFGPSASRPWLLVLVLVATITTLMVLLVLCR